MNTAPIPSIEGDPGKLAGINLGPEAALRIGVLGTAEAVADVQLPQLYAPANGSIL